MTLNKDFFNWIVNEKQGRKPKPIWKYGVGYWLWNRKFECRIHKGSSVLPILSRINPIPLLIQIYLRSILILSSDQHLGFPKGPFPVGLSINILKSLLPSSILAT